MTRATQELLRRVVELLTLADQGAFPGLAKDPIFRQLQEAVKRVRSERAAIRRAGMI